MLFIIKEVKPISVRRDDDGGGGGPVWKTSQCR